MRVSAALALFAVALLGVARLFWRAMKLGEERQEVDRFVDVFTRYRDSGGDDREAYATLVARSTRIQTLLGSDGILAILEIPFRGVVRNYPVVINAIPEMRRQFGRLTTGRDEYTRLVEESLLRYTGSFEDRRRVAKAEIKNPLIWFREGVAVLLAGPIWVLRSLGVLTEWGATRAVSSLPFKILSGFGSLVAFVAGVTTIVTGWDQTWQFIRRILRW